MAIQEYGVSKIITLENNITYANSFTAQLTLLISCHER